MKAFRRTRSKSKELSISTSKDQVHLPLAPAAASPKQSPTGPTAGPNLTKGSTEKAAEPAKKHIVDPWLPKPDEAAEINRLIAASKTQGAGNALRERRRSGGSKEIKAAPLSQEQTQMAQTANRTGNSKEIKAQPLSQEPASKAASTLAAVGLTQASPSPTRETGPNYTSSEEGSVRAKNRWKAATGAISATKKVDGQDDDQVDHQRAQLYKLLSHNEAALQNLTGAAARGARAAAVGRVKAASMAVGGKFLTPEEWHAMKFEMAQLRQQSQRLVLENRELKEQLRRASSSSAAPTAKQQHDEAKPSPLWGPTSPMAPTRDSGTRLSAMSLLPQMLKSMSPALKRPPMGVRSE